MGNTLWVLNEKRDEDEWDHSLVLSHEKYLESLADELGINRISEFYDHSILSEEYGVEAEPNYVIPQDVEVVLGSLIEAIKPDGNAELIAELEDCLNKTLEADSENIKVRLAIIP